MATVIPGDLLLVNVQYNKLLRTNRNTEKNHKNVYN